MRGAILIISLASLLSATTYCYKDKTRCFFVDDGSNKTEIIRNKAKFLELANEHGIDGKTLIGDFDSSDGYYDDDNYRRGVFIPPPHFYDDPWDDDPDYIFVPPHHPDYPHHPDNPDRPNRPDNPVTIQPTENPFFDRPHRPERPDGGASIQPVQRPQTRPVSRPIRREAVRRVIRSRAR